MEQAKKDLLVQLINDGGVPGILEITDYKASAAPKDTVTVYLTGDRWVDYMLTDDYRAHGGDTEDEETLMVV